MDIQYLGRTERLEREQNRYWCDYGFKVKGFQPENVSVSIAGGWHEESRFRDAGVRDVKDTVNAAAKLPGNTGLPS